MTNSLNFFPTNCQSEVNFIINVSIICRAIQFLRIALQKLLSNMHKTILITAAIIGAITVALGAFGAHGLKDKVNEYTLGIFETAVKYQFYHVFALLAVGILFQSFNATWLLWSARLFIAGMILFCGSL